MKEKLVKHFQAQKSTIKRKLLVHGAFWLAILLATSSGWKEDSQVALWASAPLYVLGFLISFFIARSIKTWDRKMEKLIRFVTQVEEEKLNTIYSENGSPLIKSYDETYYLPSDPMYDEIKVTPTIWTEKQALLKYLVPVSQV